MKIITTVSLLFLSACASASPVDPMPATAEVWVQGAVEFAPSTKNKLPVERYIQVKDGEIDKALAQLDSRQFVLLSKEDLQKSFPVAASRLSLGERYYLVRGPSNEGRGAYTAYFKAGELLILHTQMGGCGKPLKAAFIVRLDADIKKLYGGCSGVM
ncbi:hypothetical protein [Lysobacter capsici]|uniref:hypothetical protein n=1 Tax=Lysobacter capsici TaxID=435897 RepID=UPI001C005422|nr:hypothetical protein [Lysobacter capsici]QWF15379.1 hypothetical protein KME82_16485 [Lysobacter capsici]